MKAERWRRIQELFDGALEQPEPDRLVWMREQCAGDEVLLDEVASLLDADETVGDAVGRVVADSVQNGDPRLGERLGPYRIQRALGHGGMGTVYLAVRDDREYEQQVAIKLARGGLFHPDLLRRFRAERQILARLEHPNIARLTDGGTTSDGAPYVVMEYVEGRPIDAYARQERLSVRERLDLFRKVCSAVQYAHANLIVHRDIKPHNVLVTADGQPKLLDFGIAKLLDPDDSTTPATRTGMRMLTPEYASPEQLGGRDVTTVSDVYSLGVLLYEMLAGKRPFAATESSVVAFEREVHETEPPRPSQTESADDARELRGDLDNIVLMALRKEPERRYASVEQFSEDVRRFLEGLPVSARPNTLRYRTAKFARRHRWAVAAGGLAVGTLVLFAVAMTVQARRVAQERDAAALERLKAEQVSSFLLELFKVADPQETPGETVTARQLLDEGAEKLRGELAGQPLVRAEMLNVIGNAYQNLGLFPRAAELQDELLTEARDRAGGAATDDVAFALTALGNSLLEIGDLEGAERHLRDALAINETLYGADSGKTASSQHHLARALQLRGDTDAAEPLFRRALATLDRIPAAPKGLEAAATQHLAQIIQDRGEFGEAIEMLRRALELTRSENGEEHPITTRSRHNLAVALHQAGRLDEAEPLYRTALRLDERNLGAEHPDVGATLTNLARLLHERGDLAQAEQLARRALIITRTGHGADHPYTGYDAINLARILRDQGATDEALAHVDEALHTYSATLDPGHPWIGSALIERGRLLVLSGRAEEALSPLAHALEICRAELGDAHWLTALSRGVRGYALMELGRLDEAEALLTPARERIAAARGENDPRTRDLDRWIAQLRSVGEVRP